MVGLVLITLSETEARALPDVAGVWERPGSLARMICVFCEAHNDQLKSESWAFRQLVKGDLGEITICLSAPLLTLDMAETIARHGPALAVEGIITLISDARGVWFLHPLVKRLFIGATSKPGADTVGDLEFSSDLFDQGEAECAANPVQ